MALNPQLEGADRRIRELTRDVYLYDAKKVFMTFSAGATLVRPDDSLESALLRADEAMYQAKNRGRNQVVAIAATGVLIHPGGSIFDV